MAAYGLRRSMSGTYNPLAGDFQAGEVDTWTCTVQEGVPFYTEQSLSAFAGARCESGTEIHATKYGDWLVVKETGFCVRYADQKGNRNFRNTRMELLDKLQRQNSGDQHTVARQPSLKSSGQLSATSTMAPSSRHGSFSVDETGAKYLCPENDDKIEVWVCVSDADSVAFRLQPDLDSPAAGKPQCRYGTKVHAALDGDWLRVYEMKETVHLAQAFGRRYLHAAPTTLEFIATGTYLPLEHPDTHQKVFKREKLYYFEQSEHQPAMHKKKQESCAVM